MKKKLTPVNYQNVKIDGGVLGRKQVKNSTVTAPLLLQRCEETGRVNALHCCKDGYPPGQGPHPFWDSDIGKVVEAIAYTLPGCPNPALEEKIDMMVETLAAHQWEDGYLNSFYTTCDPDKRWTNLYYMHELYCAGHLMEGAIAYYEATGKRKFLDILSRYADHIAEQYSGGDAVGYCGHPEIELALVRLYHATGEQKYLQLSKAFIDRRGKQPYFFEEESLARGVDTTKTANQKRHLKYYLKSRGPYAEYQAHRPVREQDEPIGHAVRAMYLYSGMADIADTFQDESLMQACRTLWDAVIGTQYAIIGGVGPSSDGERFTFAYDLPNEITYNETCASVALMMWAHRMLQLEGVSKYADILEQTLYNTVLGSISLDGTRFFYANYLSVYPKRFEHASATLIDKMAARRQEWFDVSCCPPNASRLIGSLGGYAASMDDQDIFVHLYFPGKIDFKKAVLALETDYPWDEKVSMTVRCGQPFSGGIRLRIPGWCKSWHTECNGEPLSHQVEAGYAVINRQWRDGDKILLTLKMPPELLEANPKVRENCGKSAIRRGPVIYCLEEADNGESLADITLDSSGEISMGQSNLEGEPYIALTLPAFRRKWDKDTLYQIKSSERKAVTVKAIPYFLWGNRGDGEMNVWVNTI